MDYTKHYNLLMCRARGRILECYTERHHIVPRCMKGSDDASNLVDLTAEEHYLTHQLLVKMYPKNRKLIYAAAMLANVKDKNQVRNNKEYGWLKRKRIEMLAEQNKGLAFFKGFHHSEKSRANISKNNKKPKSAAHRKAQSEAAKRRWARPDQKEARIALANSPKGLAQRSRAANIRWGNI